MMFDSFRSFFFGARPESHYEIEAEGATIALTGLSSIEKIVEACKDLDVYAREYKPAPELTEHQRAFIEAGKIERKINHSLYDMGLWSPHFRPTTFRIKQ